MNDHIKSVSSLDITPDRQGVFDVRRSSVETSRGRGEIETNSREYLSQDQIQRLETKVLPEFKQRLQELMSKKISFFPELNKLSKDEINLVNSLKNKKSKDLGQEAKDTIERLYKSLSDPIREQNNELYDKRIQVKKLIRDIKTWHQELKKTQEFYGEPTNLRKLLNKMCCGAVTGEEVLDHGEMLTKSDLDKVQMCRREVKSLLKSAERSRADLSRDIRKRNECLKGITEKFGKMDNPIYLPWQKIRLQGIYLNRQKLVAIQGGSDLSCGLACVQMILCATDPKYRSAAEAQKIVQFHRSNHFISSGTVGGQLENILCHYGLSYSFQCLSEDKLNDTLRLNSRDEQKLPSLSVACLHRPDKAWKTNDHCVALAGIIDGERSDSYTSIGNVSLMKDNYYIMLDPYEGDISLILADDFFETSSEEFTIPRDFRSEAAPLGRHPKDLRDSDIFRQLNS